VDKFSVCWHEKSCGELTVRREGLHTWFHARCHLPKDGLWCVWVVGKEGDLRLGVLEPQGSEAEIKRRFSESITNPVGQIQYGEVRRVEEKRQSRWCHGVPVFFRTPWIQRQIAGRSDILACDDEKGRMIAIPFSMNQEFPLSALFCFAEIRPISGKYYAVFAFDKKEWPIFREDFQE